MRAVTKTERLSLHFMRSMRESERTQRKHSIFQIFVI